MTPLVSVIIPVYNTEKYLAEAIESCTDQTLKEIEILIVNDGSSDASPQIIDRYAAIDPRIRPINQSNGGASMARNAGIELARGEYIYCLDSDDLLRPDALQRCYEQCHSERLDLLFFDAEVFGDTPSLHAERYYRRTHRLSEGIYTGKEMMQQLLRNNGFCASVPLMMIRRRFLEEIQLRFLPGIIHEDELFTPLLFAQGQRVSFIAEAFYLRRYRKGSVSQLATIDRSIHSIALISSYLQRFHGSNEAMQLLQGYAKELIHAAYRRTCTLPYWRRWRYVRDYLTRYPRQLSLRTLAVMMCKKTRK